MATGNLLLDMNVNFTDSVADRQGASAFYEQDFQALTEGIDQIDCRHDFPSALSVFGRQAFPIATNNKGGANIAGARFGDVSLERVQN